MFARQRLITERQKNKNKMKISRIIRLAGVVLIGILLSTQVEAINLNGRSDEKKTVTLTVNKPIVDFIAKAYGDQIDSKDIIRMQKILGQIDHVTISFRDKDASDYVLKFEPLDESQLESWMFDEGYLSSDYETETEITVPWMQNIHFD